MKTTIKKTSQTKTKKILLPVMIQNKKIKKANLKNIEANIDKCRGDINLLASLSGVASRTIYSRFKEPENSHLQRRFDEQRRLHGTHPETKKAKTKSDIAEALKKFGGSINFAAVHLGKARGLVTRYVFTDGELEKIRDKEKAKHKENKKAVIQKRIDEETEKKMEIFIHNEIDESKFLPHQLEFANLSPDCVKHPALIGGYGSGKTMSIPLRWLRLIDFRAAQNKKCDMMILEPTNEMVRDILLPLFEEFFESLNIKTKWNAGHQNFTIYYHGAVHTAMLRSADKPRNLTGKNLSDIIIDEFDKIPYHKQKIVWRECISRIRKVEFSTAAVVTTPEGFKMTYELWGGC